MTPCGTCEEPNPEHARFCLGCGQPLPGGDEARKVVTVLFADVVGSTTLGEQHDPEAYQEVLGDHFGRIRATVSRHGGVVEKFIGDAVMAVFGLPVVHEDDPLRAVRAAVEIRDEVAALAADRLPGQVVLTWRLGVNTGEVLVGGAGGRTLVTGDTVNVAARLQQAADAGEVLIGAATHQLVRDAVLVEALPALGVRGKAAPLTAYRVRAVDATAPGHARRFDLPFVGRGPELEQVAWCAQRALDTAGAQLLTVYGAAGIGKTRLVSTALERTGLRTLYGRCLPYGDGVTWWPLTEALTTAAGVTTADPPDAVHRKLGALLARPIATDLLSSTAAALGLTDEPLAADPADALVAYLDGLVTPAGLALVVDDLHDAEPPLFELLERLVRSAPGPRLVVTAARPELLDRRPTWAGSLPNAVSLLLEPLARDDVAELVDGRLHGPADERLVTRVTSTAAGNPLYLEELVTALLDAGSVRRTAEGRWALTDPELPLTIPASIHGLLAARVDRLAPADRALLARAAVCGETFTIDAVRAVTPRAEQPDLAAHADALAAREFLRPATDGYEFRHRFVRDAVYAGLPRRVRAELHEQHAARLEATPASPRADEFVLLHLGRAVEERRRLDPTDPRLGALVGRAGARAAAAGRRSLARGDMPAAVRLLGQALEALPADAPDRAELLAQRGRALAEVGDLAGADDELVRAVATAEAVGDDRARMHTQLTAAWVRSNLDLDGWTAAATAVADEAVAVFAAADDARGLGRAWGLRAEIRFLSCRFGDALQAMERAEGYARTAGDEAEERENAVAAAAALPLGPWPVADGLARCRALLERFAGRAGAEARLLAIVALLEAMQGEAGAARAALGGAQQRFAELGQRYWSASSKVTQGQVEQLLGEREPAVAALRAGMEELETIGDLAQSAVVAAMLVTCLGATARDEVVTLTASARRHAARDDVEASVRLALAEARAAAVSGRRAQAVDTATRAEELAASTDSPVLEADAALALAQHLAAAGRPAAAAAQRARTAYGLKGHRVGLASVASLAEVTRDARPRVGDAR